ncbi:MAG: hypothetical protein K8S16_00670 [Bacteroidales bacterium]|nr:hypothetical protein [Bacteroidales bacterium]
MRQNNQSKGIILIHKKIGLLYIIFIVMAFLYIPADFVDIFKDINTFYEESVSENDKLFQYNSRIINYFADTDSVLNQSINQFYQQVRLSSDNVAQQIEKYKERMIEQSGGRSEFGYIKRGRNYELSKKLMIYDKVADTVKLLLTGHKNLLSKVAHKNMLPIMDSIIYLDDMLGSTGETKTFSEYYFDQVPVAASVAFLSKLQNDLKRLDNFVIESHFKSLMNNEENLGLGVNKQIQEIELANYGVSVSSLGKEIVFALEITTENTLNFPDYFTDGMLNSDPSSSMVLSQSSFELKEKDDVDTDRFDSPVIKTGYLPVLYSGINNLVRIRDISYNSEQIIAELTAGEIIRKDSNFYIRVGKPGFSRLTVFGMDEGQKVLLSSQKFEIKELPEPKAFIFNKLSGEISEKMFKVQKRVDIKNWAIEDVYMKIAGYEIKRVNNLISETVFNKGAFFNAKTRELVDKATSGDMYIFNNITVEYSDGKQVNIDPVVLTII